MDDAGLGGRGRRQAVDEGGTAMMLKVGELARRSGLTVRALHHYDQIGLLVPSARSDAGYRLYTAADVARLHAIQALRSLGVPLGQIGGLLAGDGSDLPAIVARQVRALDNEIAQATALRERLSLLGEVLAGGGQPEVDDWLGTLGLMSTYTRYFSPEEIRRIVRGWLQVKADWQFLVPALQQAMDQGLPTDDPEVQALTQRWMGLMHRWLGGDFDLMSRWGEVFAREPQARRANGPGLPLVRYVEQASERRMALWQQHFTLDELSRFRMPTDTALQPLQAAVQRALARGLAPAATAARPLLRRWHAQLVQAVGGEPGLAWRLMRAYVQQPALRAGTRLAPEVMAFLVAAAQQHGDLAGMPQDKDQGA